MEPFALKHVAEIVSVDSAYTDDLRVRYPWLKQRTIGIPYGGEPADFDYLRRHRRGNPIFNREDGCFNLSYVGRGGVDMIPALRALFQAIKRNLQSSPEIFQRLRLPFVGTTYASGGAVREQIMPVAREMG